MAIILKARHVHQIDRPSHYYKVKSINMNRNNGSALFYEQRTHILKQKVTEPPENISTANLYCQFCVYVHKRQWYKANWNFI